MRSQKLMWRKIMRSTKYQKSFGFTLYYRLQMPKLYSKFLNESELILKIPI